MLPSPISFPGQAMSDQYAALDEADEISGGSHKVLVIDDDTVHRMVICRIAKQVGFEVDEAASYEAARGMLGLSVYGCVTLDLSLGERGGIDVLQYMAEIGYASPVIVVSGSDDAVRNESVAVARKLNLNVCRPFSKPVKLADLRELMREIRKRQVVGLTPRGS
jgi:two-component system, chemotaxis family, chemotaxis protein CheY